MNETKKIPIHNAGLIILAPFLPVYFEKLGLVANGKFISYESQNRALYLLQYLVFDANYTQFTNEGILALNKIIIGLPIDAPEQFIFTISQAEKELSASLLDAVVYKWDKVQDSSIQVIQETFLQREGLIEIQEEQYLLLVEKRELDVLMQSIPWIFNLIKLPWMNQLILVEW